MMHKHGADWQILWSSFPYTLYSWDTIRQDLKDEAYHRPLSASPSHYSQKLCTHYGNQLCGTQTDNQPFRARPALPINLHMSPGVIVSPFTVQTTLPLAWSAHTSTPAHCVRLDTQSQSVDSGHLSTKATQNHSHKLSVTKQPPLPKLSKNQPPKLPQLRMPTPVRGNWLAQLLDGYDEAKNYTSLRISHLGLIFILREKTMNFFLKILHQPWQNWQKTCQRDRSRPD